MSTQTVLRRRTVNDLARMKREHEPIAMCTAYDFHSARLVDDAGIDSILVGDSLGMTMLGYDSTVPVTIDDMVFFTSVVARASKQAFLVADMPFMSYHISKEQAMANAGRLVQEAGAQAVKIEGATPLTLEIIAALVGAGIPVVAHLGLTPQSINTLGSYKTQARDETAAAQLLADAHAVEASGACAVVLECIPAELAQRVTDELSIPTIGIGAGAGCDGQVQVYHDLLGYGTFKPKHAKHYAHAESLFTEALGAYCADVKKRAFPTEDQTTHQ